MIPSSRTSWRTSCRSAVFVVFAGLAAAALAPAAPAAAHGGLPVSTQLLWRGQALYVPTQYWGIFVGSDAGLWRWICDEAINDFKLRQVYQGGDGALYATDLSGLTVSRDGGCDWRPLGGAIAALEVDQVAPDPLVADRLWVTTNGRDDQGKALARLFVGDKLAMAPAFREVYRQSGAFARGVAISKDGRAIHLLTLRESDQAGQLALSSDGGQSFRSVPLGALPPIAGAPFLTLLREDFSASSVYVRAQGDQEQVLLRVKTSDGSASELLRLTTAIYDVTLDAPRARALVSTAGGLYVIGANGAPQRAPGLERAQCAEVHDGAVYACSWNYFSDYAAVARSADALADAPFQKTPQRLFQYERTQGVLDCPLTTKVGQLCPALWAQNAPLLGINADMGAGPATADLGAPVPPKGGSCQAAPGARSQPQRAAALGLFFLLGLRLRRYASGASARHRSGMLRS